MLTIAHISFIFFVDWAYSLLDIPDGHITLY